MEFLGMIGFEVLNWNENSRTLYMFINSTRARCKVVDNIGSIRTQLVQPCRGPPAA